MKQEKEKDFLIVKNKILVYATDAIVKYYSATTPTIPVHDLLLCDCGEIEGEGRVVPAVNVTGAEVGQGRDL